MNDEIKEILNRLENIAFYASVPKELAYMTTNITPQECKIILDYITNLQHTEDLYNQLLKDYDELQQKIKHYEETTTFGDYVKEVNLLVDYKSRIEKTDWWLKEMLKQAKSDETKAIINGTLELLLNGRSDE